ncbi:MAG: S-layer homology domain-containing protein, partial [Oscillibacter sp.]|nr:S-layer homology domain-containing protein [Oscillibacter sp.]
AALQEALNAGGAIKLTADVTAAENETYLTAPEGKTSSLDLNGHTLDRGLDGKDAKADGWAICVEGELTVTDGSATAENPAGDGRITGGNSSENGGGVYVADGGVFTLEGGAISGNATVWSGGGVQVETASLHGGGTFTMTGGAITGNIAEVYGGGVSVEGGTFTMTGGVITGNTAEDGGGVMVNSGSAFAMTGGSITGNYAEEGGGIIALATITLSGDVEISGNTAEGNAPNVYLQNLYDPVKIQVAGALTNATPIGVFMHNPGEFTSGLSGNGTAENFVSDDGNRVVALTDGGEAKLVEFAAADTWAALQEALNAGGGIRLTADVTPENPFWADALVVPDGVTATLDLNGHVVDRGYTEQGFDGSVIKISGTLTLTDSSPTSDHGGAVAYADPVTGDSVEVTGGVITGGWPEQFGGGVYITGGTFNMQGGSIAGNNVGKNGFGAVEGAGGGVYMQSGSFNMSGGLIVGNKAANSNPMAGGKQGRGGGVYVNSGTFTLTGGTISGNEAGKFGGGVYLASAYSNSDGKMNVSGATTVTGNALDGAENNIYLEEGGIITVTDTLTGTIGVTMQTHGVFTSGLNGNGTAANFKSDHEDYFAALTDGGEAKLAPPTEAGTWAALQEALNAGGGIKLTADVTAAANESYLEAPEGKTSVLDLNGHTIDRGLAGGAKIYGHVMEVRGTLTVKDGSATAQNPFGDGKITGGNRLYDGGTAFSAGGVEVRNGGSFTLESGRIMNNQNMLCAGACGVEIFGSGSSFTMNGGLITNNFGSGSGGGVGVHVDASFTMNGGTITGNVASGKGGGVCVSNDSAFTMTGGTITGNEASRGGGICSWSTITLSGNVEISGNTAGGNADNVYLTDGLYTPQGIIRIAGALTNEMPIGVSMEVPCEFTEGLSGNGTAANFTSERAEYFVVLTDGGEALLTDLVEVSTWAALQAALTEGRKIRLTADVTAAENEDYLEAPAGKTSSLDLNGHTIDRGLAQNAKVNGYVLKVTGTLTVTDGSATAQNPVGSGKITGGNNAYTFANAANGGGVFVDYSGSFTLAGGAITGNHAENYGGGVFEEGDFAVTGGAITNNSAGGDGGGIYLDSGTFTISGGTITGNRSGDDGGGIYAWKNISVSGDVHISGNTSGSGANEIGSNVYLDSLALSPKLNVVGALSETAQIGVRMTAPGEFTSGLSGNGAAANFTSDDGNYTVALTDGGEAKLALASRSVTITPGEHMTRLEISGAESQSVSAGDSMGYVIYIAANQYYFPTDYTVAPVNGISVTRDGWTIIKVSGKPTADAALVLPAATAKTKEATPEAVFTATGPNSGVLTNVSVGMEYSRDGFGAAWLTVTEVPMAISGVTAENGVRVRRPASDSNTKLDSDKQVINITKEAAPTAVFIATGADSGTLTNVGAGMKYSLDGTNWVDIESATVDLTGLAAGTISVVKKSAGATDLESDAQEIGVTKAETPALAIVQPVTSNSGGSVATTAAHELRADEGDWAPCTGETTGLADGLYYVRVAASGTALASEAQEITLVTPHVNHPRVAAANETPAETAFPFTDVLPGSVFYEAIRWAYENKITAGTTPTTFSPQRGCTRAQTLTFLWRTMGSPEPKTQGRPFSDLDPN